MHTECSYCFTVAVTIKKASQDRSLVWGVLSTAIEWNCEWYNEFYVFTVVRKDSTQIYQLSRTIQLIALRILNYRILGNFRLLVLSRTENFHVV